MVSYTTHETKHDKEVPKAKDSIVTFTGGNTDGKTLFMEVDVFDGEHTHKLYPEFPFNADTKTLMEWAKDLIEKKPVFPEEISGLMQTMIAWDNVEDCWKIKESGSAKFISEKSYGKTHGK